MGELMTGIACGRALKKLAGMARPLWERCDPMPLRRAIENRYAGGPRRERQLVQDLYTTYYVGALIAAGEVVTPESVMKAQLEDRHSGNGALYWGLAALIHIQWERWDQALQAQVQAMANYDDCPLRRDVRRELQRLLCVTGYALKIHSSTLEGLEDDLSALADSAVNRFQRVEARLLLGRYHLTVGNTQAARDHLEFALAQGGETYVGLLADDLLRELEGREPSPERQWRRAMLRVEEETRRMADTCDPWPLLAALEAAQACQIPAPARAGLRMLEATALVSLGREEEAEALLAGIVLDTKGFTMRTGSRTFETAAFLRKSGADTAQVNKFFQNDLRDTVTKFHIIQGAHTYRGSIALALTDRLVGRAIAGQAADELLNIAGIEASFVLFPEAGQAYLSARSNSDVNVQVISEMLGGGGNAATAGAQFPGKTPEEVLPLLKNAIDTYFDDEKS